MEMPDQNKIIGRLFAMGHVKWSDNPLDGGPGYVFTKRGFKYELDTLDLDQYGITPESVQDCIDQLDEMGDAQKIKHGEHIRPHQGWMNAGIVIHSKVDPRISCMVTLVDQEFEDADFNLRWFIDLFKVSPSAAGPQEREASAEDLKAVERAHDMAKEKVESIDALFNLPFLDESKARKVVAGSIDGWGLPILEEDVESGVTGHVGLDAIEKPKSKEGDKDREEVDGEMKLKDKLSKPEDDPAKRKKVDGSDQSEIGGTDVYKEVPKKDVKPGDPEDKPKPVGEDVLSGMEGHVGVDAIEKPHSEEGDKDREEVDGEGKVKEKLAKVYSDPATRKKVDGSDQPEVGGTDVEKEVAKTVVKPGAPEDKPKHMEERAQRLMEARKKVMMAKHEEMKKKHAAKKMKKKMHETGEPDQEYDHELCDKIAKAIEAHGYQVKHREFDKYQGVYFTVMKDGHLVEKLWIEDEMEMKSGDVLVMLKGKKCEAQVEVMHDGADVEELIHCLSKEHKKENVQEGVEHPVKVVEGMKKHVDEAHRAIKKAHHLVEWAKKKMVESHAHLPQHMSEKLQPHHMKMHECSECMSEAKKHMSEVRESVEEMHKMMKKK